MSIPVDPHTPTPPPSAHGPRILLVDDEGIVRMVARVMLERSGFSVEEADSATAALGRVRSAPVPFAVVVLDYTLPDCTGTDVIPDLRRLAPGSRIVLTSGRAEEDVPDHGADGFLPKPFTRDQIVAALRAATAAAPG